MRVFLTGFMGSGKSHIGKQLAERTGLAFVDLDSEIEKGEGRTISEIFTEGEETFRALEGQYLRKMERIENAIIATGGGTPCFHSNMDWMNANGITVYLKVNPAILAERLSSEIGKRPLLNKNTELTLIERINALLSVRQSFYESVHFCYEIEEKEQNVTDELAYLISNYLK